jgi:hypothetical protein
MKNQPKQSARPLKCKLCSRRFKYSACVEDHLQKDHFAMIVNKLQKLVDKQQSEPIETYPAIRVSVIKRNHQEKGLTRNLFKH